VAYPESFFDVFRSWIPPEQPEKGYAVNMNTVVSIQQPETVQDALTEVLRRGAQQLLKETIELEVAEFLQIISRVKRRKRLSESGPIRSFPQREIQTGIGNVAVRIPRVRDRGGSESSPERIHFRSPLCLQWLDTPHLLN